MTSVIRSNVFCSRPLARLTTGIHGWIHSLAARTVERIAVVGTPITSSSAWRIAFSRSSVAIRRSGSSIPERYASFVCRPSISAAVSGLRAQIIVVCRTARTEAIVVPHDPAPNTVTCMATTYAARPVALDSRR